MTHATRWTSVFTVLGSADAVAVSPAAGPESAAGTLAPQHGGTLTVSIRHSAAPIDPQKNNTVTDQLMASLVAERVVDWVNRPLVLVLAKSRDASPNGLHTAYRWSSTPWACLSATGDGGRAR